MEEILKIIIIVLSILLGLYILVTIAATIYVMPLINNPKRKTREWQKEYFSSVSDHYKYNKLDRNPIKFIMKDGYEINGDYTIKDKKRFVILAHGHTSTREGMIMHATIFDSLGFSTICYDQRGHGDNKRCSLTLGYQEGLDLNEIINQVKDRFGNDIEIGLCGVSMGGDTVLQITRYRDEKEIKFILCDCGYAKLHNVIKHDIKNAGFKIFPILPLVKLFTPIFYHYHYSDIDILDSVNVSKIPILFILGTNDKVVPITESITMNKNRPNDTIIHLYDGSLHAKCIIDDYDRFFKETKEFLDKFYYEK